MPIEPRIPADAAPAIEPANPDMAAPQTEQAVPKEIAEIPAFSAVLAGTPPAVSANMKALDKSPEANALRKHRDWVMKAGMGLYRSLDGSIGVVFNSLYVNPEELKQADQNGQLEQLAPPLEQVNQSVSASGADHPVLKRGGNVPSDFAQAPMPTPPAASQLQTLPAGAQSKIASARAKNLKTGKPTDGPRPGSGRLLNEILKPVV